jgi:hypothetical protein
LVHERNWCVYLSLFDDSPGSVLVDLGAGELDRSSLPTLVRLRVQAAAPDEVGLPGDDDLEAVSQVEAVLGGLLREQGVYVGRQVYGGHIDLFVYASSVEAFKPVLIEAAEAAGDRQVEFSTAEDPEWEIFEEELWPTAAEYQQSVDQQVMLRLRESGDTLTQPREVDHLLILPTAEAAEEVRGVLRQRGFRIKEPTPDDEDESVSAEDTQEHAVECSRSDTPNQEEFLELTMSLLLLANEHGGRYDGWGSPVVQDDPDAAKD